MKIGRLFVGMDRTTDSHRPIYVISSWAYVTGYWRWALYWAPVQGFRDAFRWPSFAPNRAKWFGGWGITSFAGWIYLPVIGILRFSTQPPMESMKTLGGGK